MALSAQAVAATPKVITRPSFAELFRRSKFATYDPAIRQTYQAPPANAHRGDWGVKRPISLRRKNAFISLTSFEHHAHFTEWNHAENQVRFIRRIEEMGGKAEMSSTSTWYKSSSSANTEPSFDSDFCPGEKYETLLPPLVQSKTVQSGNVSSTEAQPEEVQSDEGKPEMVNLETLGKRGPGAYGTQREQSTTNRSPHEVYVTPNIQAMSKREFRRYLRSLRAQRSEFKEFIQAEDKIEEKDLHALVINGDNHCYRKFLQSQMQKEFADYSSQKMEPRPHPNGALLYTEPTALEIFLWSRGKPGFYLHELTDPINSSTEQRRHIVSFGGLLSAVTLDEVSEKQMLLAKHTDQGVDPNNIQDSVVDLKLDPFRPIRIIELPRTVGNKPQGLKAVKVQLTLVKGDAGQMGSTNSHSPGSKEYNIMTGGKGQTPLSTFEPTMSVFSGERRKDTDVLLRTLQKGMRTQNVVDDDL